MRTIIRNFTTLAPCTDEERPDEPGSVERRIIALQCLDLARATAGAKGLCVHDWTMAILEEAVMGFMASGGDEAVALQGIELTWRECAKRVNVKRCSGKVGNA